FGPKAQPLTQRRAKPWKTEISIELSFRPNGPTLHLALGLQCGDRLGLRPEIRWRGRCLIQGCALRWANFWAFGPNIKQAANRNCRSGSNRQASLDPSDNLTLSDKPDKTEPVEGGQRI
ncbi:MAG: hypothetical protein WCJ35_27150, partial [Planctomycetota bacterium]